jgi:hypothetical protein
VKVNKHLRWFLWGGLIGTAAAALLCVLFPFTQSPLIFRTIWLLDWSGFSVTLSDWVFSGDRISYGWMLDKEVFFDVVLSLATGLQAGILAVSASLIFRRNRRRHSSPSVAP